MNRTLIWWSTGAASAVMAQLMLREEPEAVVVRCETGNEDPDNYRFEADVMRRLNTSVTLLKSDEFENVRDVWKRERFMAGPNGASCTRAMKVEPRLAFQHPTDRRDCSGLRLSLCSHGGGRMRCYLAHPVTDYGGTERQRKAMEAIEARGWTVESPDKPWHQDGYKLAGMDYFIDLVRDCDVLAYLPFPSGKIGAGVAQEIAAALTRGLMVFDVSADFAPVKMMPWNLLTIEETRAEIAAIRAASLSLSSQERE